MADKEVPKIRIVAFNEKSPAKKGELSSCDCVCQCDSQCDCENIIVNPHSKGGKDSPRTFFRLAGDRDKIE